jgi:putative SOS response-associated peptidase YedK
MCGRFTLTLDPVELRQAFDLGEMPEEWIPRYNIAPTQPVAVVTDASARKVDFMRWGLVPSWAKDISIGSKLINARGETVAEKPSFRSAFARRRCLILADGFYEWQKTGTKSPSIPYYFRLEDGGPFAFAGLWEFWQSSEGDGLKTCTIITTEANARVAPVHDRMPVILNPQTTWAWLGEGSGEALVKLLKPYPAEEMVAYKVSRMVNDPGKDVAALIKPQTELGSQVF